MAEFVYETKLVKNKTRIIFTKTRGLDIEGKTVKPSGVAYFTYIGYRLDYTQTLTSAEL